MKLFNTDAHILKVDKAKYKEFQTEIADSNDTILRLSSFVSSVVFLILLIISLNYTMMKNNSIAYILCFVLSALVFLSCEVLHIKNNIIREIRVILFIFVLLGYGIVMGTLVNPTELTVAYIVFMFSVPMFFLARPLKINILVGISMAAYIVAAYFTQPQKYFIANLFDVIVYGLMSMVISSYMMVIKMQRFLYKERTEKLEEAGKKSEERIEKYESFMTDMIRYSATDGDVEDIINQILEYIGEKFESDRAYIFEVNGEGSFDNTFEWCREGVKAEIDNLQGLPYEGMIDIWFNQYKNEKNILIRDVEEYKSVSKPMYDILKSQDITTLVTGPIKMNGNIIGFYGVDNPPLEIIDTVSELIDITEYVISMMVRLKNDAKELVSSAYHDQLTGCKNRMALTWAYRGKYDRDKSMTVIMCDLNGLKEINDKQGHDAGDKFILRTVGVLSDVFGRDYVYRMGGDEFLIVLTDTELTKVEELLDICRLQLGNTACIGYAYREQIGLDFDAVLKEADTKLYDEKANYYQTHKKYRDV